MKHVQHYASMYAVFLKYSETAYIIYENLNSTQILRFSLDTNLKSILKFLKITKVLTYKAHFYETTISNHLSIFKSTALAIKIKCILIPVISKF